MIDYIWHMVLPVSSLVILGFGSWALYVRNLMVKVLRTSYFGEGQRVAAKIDPVAPCLSLHLTAHSHDNFPVAARVVSGAVITETVFSLHGVGRFLLESVTGQDYPAAGAAFFLLALLTVICNLLADLAYGFVDPRIGLERKMER